jgi:2-keto-3-deoxy-L-rhamnonate aldolase RhmA
MLETPNAIQNAEEIAAVPGIDSLLIGTNDLTMEMGIPGELGHNKIVDAYEHVIAACAKHNKYPGMGGVYNPDLMQTYINMGARLILAGNDISFLSDSARRQAETVHAMLT